VLDEAQTHRPLIACTLVGLILGDVKTGLILGGTLELMALGWMNVGMAMAPDTAMASVISTMLVVKTGQGIGEGIAIAVVLAAAGQVLTIIARTVSVVFLHKGDHYAAQGNTKGIDFMHYLAMFVFSLRLIIPTLLIILINVNAFQSLLNAIPEVVTKGLQVGGGIIVVVGYAMIINMMKVPYLMPFFFLGFVIAAFTNFNLVGLGILGVCLALIFSHVKYAQQAKPVAAKATQADDDDLDA
jgi:mannose/fructose/sorbose-specific phosphotransferase system IIC component